MRKRFKLGLALLLLGLFGFTCFSSSGSYTYTGSVSFDNMGSNQSWFSLPVPRLINNINDGFNLVCLFTNINSTSDFGFRVRVNNFSTSYTVSYFNLNSYNNVQSSVVDNSYTFDYTFDTSFGFLDVIYFQNYPNNGNNISFNYSCTFSGNNIIGGCPECQECVQCPEIDTGSILSGSCDINYCVENGLCPTGSGSWSELMINDVVHESAPFINITIPYEYSWDYTVDENEFNLVISGQNVDYEYIDGIIRTQQSKPNNTDFNNIVSGLIPLLIPGLVIILFLRFIFKFIKKIF